MNRLGSTRISYADAMGNDKQDKRMGESLYWILMELAHMLSATLLSLLLLPFLQCHSQTPVTDTDLLALLSFKSLISDDPLQSLVSWNDTSLDLCRWPGVTCGARRHPDRVTTLDLDSLDLAGLISPSIANLTFLQRLHLPNNRLSGRIPPEIGRLHRLRRLNLTSNSLTGEIPPTLTNCTSLEILAANDNLLTGGIPVELASLTHLAYLGFAGNNLTGEIPPSLGNMSRLLALDLDSNRLFGSIPRLPASLAFLYLHDNQLSGVIPPELGQLSSLHYMFLNGNSLTGEIPASFHNLTSLIYFHLFSNNLTGNIPSSLGSLAVLTRFDVSGNSLSGEIPPSLGNLSSLGALRLTKNLLSGEIPTSIGSLFSLSSFAASHNQLSGEIPSSLYNLSGIETLGVANNQLIGMIPSDIGQALPRLQALYMYFNRLQGPIPMSLANATGLVDVELTGNKLTGTIPSNLGMLRNLYWLNLDRNQLEARDDSGWSFLASLANCSSLQVLQLDENQLGGMLPSSIANLSVSIEWLSIGGNGISGSLPEGIGYLVNLTLFAMDRNNLTGSIPSTIGKLERLQTLGLSINNLAGSIPESMGNMTLLNNLYLQGNALSGTIPQSLGNCRALENLDVSENFLTGSIPKQIVSISSLSKTLDLSHNFFEGSLPSEIGRLKNLMVFNASNNNLSGEIPTSIGECQVLEILRLEGNQFRGNIPSSLTNLQGIQQLDLSRNNLWGRIPSFLASFRSLYYLNLSFNNFEGEVPSGGVFENASAVSVLGNPNLCGGGKELQCPTSSSKKRHQFLRLKVIVPVAISALCLLILTCSLVLHYWIRNSRTQLPPKASIDDSHKKVSYSELLKATEGFSSSNLIGVGSFGSVYKGVIDHEIVAVKVLNLLQRGASKSFVAECNALQNIRHRNLVKIVTACSSTDFSGDEFKALVFEFMANGSLDERLHSAEGGKLSLDQRMDIAIDVAHALDYLHHHGGVAIVHCDLKPSNVLLDDDMNARVSDFGLSRFLTESLGGDSTASAGVRGTIGYVPPEYGMTIQVSTEGDVYSYGILLLELFTGMRPTNDTLTGLSLHKFVKNSFPDRIIDIIDPQLSLQNEEDENHITQKPRDSGQRSHELLVSVLRIALSCSESSPMGRMKMGDVVKEMVTVKDMFVHAGIHGEGRMDAMKREGPSSSRRG